MLPGLENREQLVKQGMELSKAAWNKLSGLYDSTPGRFLLGEAPCFVDFVIAGRIKFALNTLSVVEVGGITNLGGVGWRKVLRNTRTPVL
ncbi:hypothetical protein BS17DRAFT_782577 [Gyrodon lividus]|nr:hypothetical protein BS17DRAFT_782577 [Gyrodon lividus]